MSRTDNLAEQLQQQADTLAAHLVTQDPAPAGSDLAWQQEQIRSTYEDAAHLADQPGSR
jgi:predicted transposase YdaD